MRPRPQPNPRRGLLRAGVVVIVLTIILLIVIFIVSTLTAPPAKAPAVVPTPPPLTPQPLITPRPTIGPAATARPTAKAKATAKPSHDIGLAPPVYALNSPRAAMRVPAVRNHRLPYFTGAGDAYKGRVLMLGAGRGRKSIRIGRADPYIRPIVSADGRAVLFVRVSQVSAYPGARWTLLSYDRPTQRTTVLVRMTGMGLTPLGWRGADVLFTVANSTDTTIYAVRAGHVRVMSMLVPQPVNGATLSPGGHDVAYVTPADCDYCTLAMLNLDRLTTWHGPSGLPNEDSIAWSADGGSLAAPIGVHLGTVDTTSHAVRLYREPAGLPLVWNHVMTVSTHGRAVTLRDSWNGRVYSASAPSR